MLIIYVVAFIAIFYFMAIRPQQRQRKAHAALLASLKKGDSVITASGIYGTVKRVEDNLVVVEIARGVTIKMTRSAISQIVRDKREARAYAPEPTGRRGKREPIALEEENLVDESTEAVETVDSSQVVESIDEAEAEMIAEDEAISESADDYAASEEAARED